MAKTENIGFPFFPTAAHLSASGLNKINLNNYNYALIYIYLFCYLTYFLLILKTPKLGINLLTIS